MVKNGQGIGLMSPVMRRVVVMSSMDSDPLRTIIVIG